MPIVLVSLPISTAECATRKGGFGSKNVQNIPVTIKIGRSCSKRERRAAVAGGGTTMELEDRKVSFAAELLLSALGDPRFHNTLLHSLHS